MADPLHELLYPTAQHAFDDYQKPSALTSAYTTRLSTLSVAALTSTEPEALHHDAQSLLRSLQALAKRSYKSINVSATASGRVRDELPNLSTGSDYLQNTLPTFEARASSFSQKYSKPTENQILDRRRRAMSLNDNIERISDVLDLPALLQSTIAASSGSSTAAGAQSSTSAHASYASALDLYAHIKRLHKLYPKSALIDSIVIQAEDAMRGMTIKLISTLRSQNLKLAGAMRLTGLLRRVAPELEENQATGSPSWTATSNEGSLGALFLVCRLANLTTTLDALEPLRELADQEMATPLANVSFDERNAWAAGQQTERYLKRYIEVFREQCFAIVSMFKSVFPMSLQGPLVDHGDVNHATIDEVKPTIPTSSKAGPVDSRVPSDPMQSLPSALSTFCFELVDKLMDTLRQYMPNVRDRSSRDSLLTQVLYCSGSLGRLGGDFGMMLAVMQEELEEADEVAPATTSKGAPIEWIEAMKKHRIQAGRLELLASGAGTSKLSAASGRWAIAKECLSYPTNTKLSRTTALTNRPLSFEDSHLPRDSRLKLADGVNLTLPESEGSKLLREKVPSIETMTYVFFTAHIEKPDYSSLFGVNTNLLRNAISAVSSLSPRLKTVILQTGGKRYGVEFLDKMDLTPPLKESLPRIPKPYPHNIFYYSQYDELEKLSKKGRLPAL